MFFVSEDVQEVKPGGKQITDIHSMRIDELIRFIVLH